jgi:hypothetical protein
MPNLTQYEKQKAQVKLTSAVSPDQVVTTVNQQGANAGGNIVGGNLVEQHIHIPHKAGVIEKLLLKLHEEIQNNQEVRETIEALAHYHVNHDHDGVVGLEAKLKAGNRLDEYPFALEEKEQFAKLLEKWSLYASAQEIMAFLLGRATYEFRQFILPQLQKLPPAEINQLIKDNIITPAVDECGASVFNLNHSVAMGMVYWLADHCFVRWHHNAA